MITLPIEEIILYYQPHEFYFCVDEEEELYAIHKRRLVHFDLDSLGDAVFAIGAGRIDDQQQKRLNSEKAYGVNFMDGGLHTSVILHSEALNIYSFITDFAEMKHFSFVLDSILNMEGSLDGSYYNYRYNDYVIKQPLFGAFYQYIVREVLDEITEELSEY